MGSGLIFLVALVGVFWVIIWSIQHDLTNALPRSGLFGLRQYGGKKLLQP